MNKVIQLGGSAAFIPNKNRQYENEDLVDKLFNLKYKTSKYSLYKI